MTVIERRAVSATPDGRLDRSNAEVYLGYRPGTLSARASKGLPPKFVRVGGRVFYRIEDLDAFISAGE